MIMQIVLYILIFIIGWILGVASCTSLYSKRINNAKDLEELKRWINKE